MSLWQLILWLKKGISNSNRLNITEKPYIYLSVSLPPILSVTDGLNAQKEFASVLFQGFTSDDCEKMNEFFEKITNNIQNHFKQED